MLFNTPTFLWFFVIVYVVFRLLPAGRPRTVFLILASSVFYMSWNPPFVLLLIFSTVFDYNVSLAMARTEQRWRRTGLLLLSLAGNLGVLGFFKYANFFMGNFQVLLHAVSVEFQPQPYNIVLPLGISFYTFQTMSYSLDVYRGAREPTRDWLAFALYVTFFPQLVAGPIVRSEQFLPQIERHQRFTWPAFYMGCNLMMIGLMKKMLLADNLALYVEQVYANPAGATTLEAWIATYAFAGQIYCDFSGYTDIARGLGYVFGYRLPVNFNLPHLATGFRDFWRRWHITLSTWLRDYLYIPLGGSRRGRRRNYFNLYMTMALGGLWHGASWNFVIWGSLHGFYLMAERALCGMKGLPAVHGWRRVLAILVTFHLTVIAWVFFRAQTFSDAAVMLRHMLFEWSPRIVNFEVPVAAWLPLAALAAAHALASWRTWDPTLRAYPRWLVPILYTAAAAAIMLYGAVGAEFIYFQF
ncbi:MAG: MBOAT family protein [Armatimonadota bacterium]|nr:MAG: MBOAT family protein [Armatimonadota bacterium]